MRWQYCITRIASITSKENNEVLLNRMGEGGWELIAVTTGKRIKDYFWKRPRDV